MSIKYKNSQQIALLQACLDEIEAKLNWSDSANWRHSHFELLSEKIFEETQVKLSAVTLKRLWGKVTYHSFPSMNTLDVLAKFLGHENWIYFQQNSEKRSEKNSVNINTEANTKRSLNSKHIATVVGFLAFIIFASQLALTQWPGFTNTESVKFDFEPVTEGIPNTVIFTYDVKETHADSVFIQQSWDTRLRQEVEKQGQIHTSTYYYPGFFKAKLLLNEKIVSEKNLFVKSNGWLATIEQTPVPFYLDYQEVAEKGILEITSEHLTNKGYDLNDALPYSSFHLVKDFGDISGNNFRLRTEFKSTLGLGDAICKKSRIIVLCSETPFILPFSIEGCVGELDLYVPGKSIVGTKNDLSGFGVDFSDWVKLDLTVSNKIVDIFVNDVLVFQDTLSRDPGKVVGIRYKFHGAGAVKSLNIQTPDTLTYQSHF